MARTENDNDRLRGDKCKDQKSDDMRRRAQTGTDKTKCTADSLGRGRGDEGAGQRKNVKGEKKSINDVNTKREESDEITEITH